jgi:23S rRNA (guanosine2251-2'-O)-methyltransferase
MVKKAKKIKQAEGVLIYGIHPVLELLRSKRRKLISIYTTKPVPKQWKLIEQAMPPYPVAIQYVDRGVLHRMANSIDHQGVVAWVKDFVFRKKPFEPSKQPFLLLLDNIQDPRNLGAILRSAYCTGVSGVIITLRQSAPLNAVTIKSSAGLAEHLEIQQVPSAPMALQELKRAGYEIYLAAHGGENAIASSYDMPLCLVIGNEAVGIEKQLLKYGKTVTLPQKEADISYNASVAAGILLFTISSRNKIV